MAETMNMMELPVDRFCNEIRLEFEDENYNPVIGIGKSGVGKTMSIYEMTQQLGIGFCELRLVTMTEVDLLGIPVIEDGRTTYASNSLLPDAKRDGESGILVLDEITSASSTIRAAAYQLLDSKRALGNYKLPPKWKVVGLGNGIDDGGVFTGMENAFLSRATCYRIEPDVRAWKSWALTHDVNPSVIAFINFQPDKIHDMKTDGLASVFPCPRSWTALSTKLNAREKRANGKLSPDDVELYAAGTVGMTVASEFAAFYQFNEKSISALDILAGKVDAHDMADVKPEVVHLTLQSLIKQSNIELAAGRRSEENGDFTSECVKRIANMVKWVVDLADVRNDYAISAFTDLASGVKDFVSLVLFNQEFDEICPDFLAFATAKNIVFHAQDR